MVSKSVEQSMTRALCEVYGDGFIDSYGWAQLREQHPGLSLEQQMHVAMTEFVTCSRTNFLKNPNIRDLPRWMAQEEGKSWKVLSAGCATGPEPQELALRFFATGVEDFAIDAFDVVPEYVQEASTGILEGNLFNMGMFKRIFIEDMEAKRLLKIKHLKSKGDAVVIDPKVMSHIAFAQHDIIDAPYLPTGQESYDLVICNNVLFHYPRWTQELILTHLVESLHDGGVLALEYKRFFDDDDRKVQPSFAAQVEDYQEWREDLTRFGLEKTFLPMFKEGMGGIPAYRYTASQNQYRGRRMVIRDRNLVEHVPA